MKTNRIDRNINLIFTVFKLPKWKQPLRHASSYGSFTQIFIPLRKEHPWSCKIDKEGKSVLQEHFLIKDILSYQGWPGYAKF